MIYTNKKGFFYTKIRFATKTLKINTEQRAQKGDITPPQIAQINTDTRNISVDRRQWRQL